MQAQKKMAIYINNKCNRNCSFCYVDKTTSTEMDMQVMNKIINYINSQETNKYRTIIFVGGEPLLSLEKITYFIDNIKHTSINYGIMTNGTMNISELVNKIDCHNLAFNISFISTTSKDNKLKIQNIKYLKQKHIQCNALIVNTPNNINKIFDLLLYLIKIKPNYIKVLRQHKMGDFWTQKDIDEYAKVLSKLMHLSIYCKEKFTNVNQISLPNKIDIPISCSDSIYDDYAINLVDQDSICKYDIVGIDGKQYLCDGACGENRYSFGYIWDSPVNPYIIKEFGYQDVLYDYCYLANNPCCLSFDRLNDKYRSIYQSYLSRLEELK